MDDLRLVEPKFYCINKNLLGFVCETSEIKF